MKSWLKKIIREELALLFRPKSPAILLLWGIPIAYSILFGFAYSKNVVNYIPTVIYDQDQTAVSRALVQTFIDSERYDVVAQVTTQEAMENCLREGTAVAAIAVPPKFAHDIKNGLAATVLIETNAVNLMFANTVISSSQEIIQTFNAKISQNLFEGVNQMPAQALRSGMPVKFSARIINNPTSSYSNFMLAGLGANGLQLAIVLVICTVLTKEYANLTRWKGCPTLTIITGKLIPYWLCATVAFLAYIAVIAGLFGVPFRGGVLSLLLIGGAFSWAVCAVGLFFSAIAWNEVIAIQAPILYIMPAFLFSGYSWPQFAMNGFSRAFSAILPLSYAADSIRDIMLAGYAPDLISDALTLVAFGLTLLLVSAGVFSWRRSRAAKAGEVTAL